MALEAALPGQARRVTLTPPPIGSPAPASVTRRIAYLSGAPRVSTRPEAELSGPRAHVLGVMNAFRDLGCDVRPFIAGDHVPPDWISAGSGARIKGWPRRFAADLMRMTMGIINARRAPLALRGPFDYVYERLSALQSLGWIFQRQGAIWILESNAPLFLEAHGDRETIALSGLARRIEIRAYRRADIVVCVSPALKTIIAGEANLDPRRIVVVPNGVDTRIFDPQVHEPRRTFEGFTIGFVGTLYAWQGLGDLLHAIHDLRNKGLAINLAVAGDGPMRAGWETLAGQLGLTGCTRFLGRIPPDEVPPLIAGFDVCFSGQIPLQTGEMYLSPIKLYEYMAMGKPVVASSFQDARSLIRDGENGWLFLPEDRAALSQALEAAYRNSDSLKVMGSDCRRQIVAHHSWSARVIEMMAAVETLAAR
jgi:glycosyltransferase involved in cell wall biosynthesis